MTHAMTALSEDSKVRNLPGWFAEGVAVSHENDEPYRHSRENLVRRAVEDGRLIPWSQMEMPSSQWDIDIVSTAYALSGSIWNYLAETYGEEKMLDVFYTEGKFSEVIEEATGRSLSELETDWRSMVIEKYDQ